MNLVLESPTVCRLPQQWLGSAVEAELADTLQYEDLGVTHEWRRYRGMQRQDDAAVVPLRRRPYFVEQNGRDALDAKVAALEAQRIQTTLFRDDRGMWTYSGLAPRLSDQYGVPIQRTFRRPKAVRMEWHNLPPFDPRPYQAHANDLLCSVGHGGVELATGLGKSLIIALLCSTFGLPTLVVAPSLNIAEQLLEDLTFFFGKRAVGAFFAGKKEAGKLITVAVSASLLRVEAGSETAKILRTKQVLIGDESHLLPAESLSRVILGLLAPIPWRFFLSGTQIRNDGLDIVLEGIIGKIMLRMSVREGVDAGYLSRPRFFQFEVKSNSNFSSADVIAMNRTHLHRNPLVYKHAGKMIDWATRNGRRVLVLVDELDQYRKLMQYGKLNPASVRFAHGGMDKETRKDYPEEVHKSDPMALVKSFDKGDYSTLIGTSCISVGTDIKSASLIVDLIGLTSEIRVRQGVGRGTRLFPGKTDCWYVDYKVSNIDKLAKHAKERARIFEDIYGPVSYQVAS